MTDTFLVNPGYRYDGETIEITQQLAEDQFRAIEDILCRHPQRFKSWAETFTFDPGTPGLGEQLRSYLHDQRIAHSTELRATFALDELQASEHSRT